jgi:predicted signal transduction protein with EAL and GGDEF domain
MVLRAISERLVAISRASDRVARWGGEEFVFVLPQATATEVDALAGRLLDAIGAAPVTLIDGRQWPVTVSIGWAVFPLPPHALALPWGPALSIADRLLYRAKAAGRNQAHGLAAAPGVADADSLREAAQGLDDAAANGRVELWWRAGPAPSAATEPAGAAVGAAAAGDDQTRRTRTL